MDTLEQDDLKFVSPAKVVTGMVVDLLHVPYKREEIRSGSWVPVALSSLQAVWPFCIPALQI